MAKARQEIDAIIRRFCASLATLGIRTARAYLFGSYALGTARDDSDIDLIIVSDDFEGKNIRERLEALGTAAALIMQPVQAHGYTTAEIDADEKSALLKEALSHAQIAA